MTVVVGRRWTTWKKDNYRLYVWVPEGKQYVEVYSFGYDGFDNNGGGAWEKYINIPITTTPSEYAQYQVVIDATNVTVHSADGTQKAQGAVASDFWANVKSDGLDVRVFDQAKGQLYFWIEEFDYSNKKAVIWVNLTAGSSELNIAYGNPSATKSSYENGEQVFEFFDDFEGSELNTAKWDTADLYDNADINVSNGILTYYRGDTTLSSIKTLKTFAPNTVLYAKVYYDTSYNYPAEFGFADSQKTVPDNSAAVVRTTEDTYGAYASSGGTYSVSEGLSLDTGWTKYMLKWTDSEVAMTDGVNTRSVTSNIPTFELPLRLGNFLGGGTGNVYLQYDYIYVAKLADPADFGTSTIRTF